MSKILHLFPLFLSYNYILHVSMCVSGSTTLILEEYTIHIGDPSNFQVVNVDKQYFRKVTYTPLAWTAALGSPILLKIMNSFSGAAEPPAVPGF